MEGQRNPFDQALCLSVSLHAFGTSRKVDPELVETDANRKFLKVSKKIFESNAMEQIKEIYQGIRDHLHRYTIVGAMFKSGMYLVPFDQVTQVEEYIRSKKESLDYWLFQLEEEYEGVKEQFRAQLGSLYKESDYPEINKVKRQFGIEYEFLAIDVPTALRYINNGIWQREQEKAQARVQVVSERIEEILVKHTQELIEHLIERLTDTSDGKRKKFATNMLDKAKDFFDTLQSRNLTGSETLNDLAERGREILQGVDLDTLKDDAGMRERLRQRFETVKESMAGMITAAPRRALNLQDEEEVIVPSTNLSNDPVHEYGPPDAETDEQVTESIFATPEMQVAERRLFGLKSPEETTVEAGEVLNLL